MLPLPRDVSTGREGMALAAFENAQHENAMGGPR